MKKNIILMAMGCLAGSAIASASNKLEPNDSIVSNSIADKDLQPLSPTYLDGVYQDYGWRGNWFLTLQGGANTFIGNPTGCGDLWSREEPLLNASVGKWLTPFWGGRVAFQGLRMKDTSLQTNKFQSVHADFLYNLSSHCRKDVETLCKWDAIPYIGVGILRNNDTGQKPFAFSYGINLRCRLAHRLHLSAEIGGTTTFRDFDLVGEGNKLGDNIFHGSIGLSMTVGKVGWKRVIDAKPYIYQNDILVTSLATLKRENEKLSKELAYDEMALAEMRKILEIEGLLGKYKIFQPGSEDTKAQPKNNYSGLNSLRARLRNRNWNGDMDSFTPELTAGWDESASNDGSSDTASCDSVGNAAMSTSQYMKLVTEGRACIGAPIFFFYKVGSANLIDISQEINAKEIAKVMKKYSLRARIIGAADSGTGTREVNERLSDRRANHIAKLLKKHDVPESQITIAARGGINEYLPSEGNRNTCVMLYTK